MFEFEACFTSIGILKNVIDCIMNLQVSANICCNENIGIQVSVVFIFKSLIVVQFSIYNDSIFFPFRFK